MSFWSARRKKRWIIRGGSRHAVELARFAYIFVNSELANPSIQYLECTIRLLREAGTSIWPLKIYPWLNLVFWNPWEYIGAKSPWYVVTWKCSEARWREFRARLEDLSSLSWESSELSCFSLPTPLILRTRFALRDLRVYFIHHARDISPTDRNPRDT